MISVNEYIFETCPSSLMSVASYSGAQLTNYLPPQQPPETPNGAHHPTPRTTLRFTTPPTVPSTKRRSSDDDEDSPEAGSSKHNTSSRSQKNGTTAQRRNSSKTPAQYGSSTEMMAALAACFKPGGESSFSGTYTIANDPPISDKYRIQLVSNDIWRATGYRFTVKDHPPMKDGHKTRLWCSQDSQRKSKPHSKARLAASGEYMAKTRYPCRSRLLISSRDCGLSGHRMITIRMYHHVCHEPYYDPSVPLTTLQAVWGMSRWPTFLPPAAVQPTYPPVNPYTSSYFNTSSQQVSASTAAAAPVEDWESGSEGVESGAEGDSEMEDEPSVALPPPSVPLTSKTPAPLSVRQILPPSAPSRPSSSSSQPTLHTIPRFPVPAAALATPAAPAPPPSRSGANHESQTENFQRAMRQHIRNMREFCDGLEYQVQFNDFRMLEELETQGASFLRYVRTCLIREGRLTEEESHLPTPSESGADS
ncbi:hypothetical protein D9758_012285 [Tetrapyrgos nigripes]|uniref:Uncharacterized protein n=1 Tax=Tetrapyrgos nigripes TaxID=182062 RepID=A0A8H5FM36_9AGAR|nr:hypothetical protein D9758_012285 [Tetrapyrgos nigripes]